ncbi:MAG: RnfABCDGE type electron transport complex subunit B, partial [Eubacterium sp.]|nr:RnfABCDGE type electron transport complex subunit B [Eubacterium sp.]
MIGLSTIQGILLAVAIVGGVGLIIGILLGIAGKVFSVEVNEKELAVREALPGNNCGGCGYPGCDGCAVAIVKGEAKPNACPVGGEKVANEISKILGVE